MLTHEYFAGKSIFITGGTGFLGKVLIEKLLRSCPDVGNIYILIREKKGKSISQRMEAMKALPLYDLVREQNSSLFDKLIPVKGDVCEINLGLSPEDRKILTENVNIIYHTAASVRFDDLLRYAILLNVRGTREVAKLALDLKNISLFVHTSTTYCNIDKKVIEEQLYRPHGDWGEAIRLAEEYDEEILKTFTEKYIQPLPNTYTYAKSLAEHVVNDMCSGKIPTLIVRPSVVISTLDEPVKGWNDNLNGPVGLLLAGGKGLMRTILGKSTAAPDYIPVDMTIKAFLVATRNYAENLPENKVEVINISQGAINRISIGEVIDMGKEVIQQSPFSTSLWYPRFEITNCWFNYFIQVLLFHMLPAVFLDIALRLSGRKPMLFTLQRKIYIANVVLSPFLSSTWIFKNDKILKIVDAIDKREEKTFGVGKMYLSKEEQIEYFKNGKIGGAIYVLKEDVDPKAAKTNLKRLWYLDITVRIIFYLFLFWLVVVKINIVKVLFNTVENYFKNL